MLQPKRIANPAYKGEWVHPEIDNPEYFDDPAVYKFSDISLVCSECMLSEGCGGQNATVR